MSRVRIFAGPNGSGKSTLYQQIAHEFNTGIFLNADLIEQQLSQTGLFDLSAIGISATSNDWDVFKKTPSAKSLINKAKKEDWKIDLELKENFLVDVAKESHSYESSLAAAFLREQLMIKNKTFSYETVMSHHLKLDEMKMANTKGYRTYLYFVCTDDPLVNISRIKNRVTKGGHDVDEKKAVGRYYRSLELLIDAIKLCYRSYLFDNSGSEMKLIAETFQTNLKIINENIPIWINNYVLNHYKP